MKFYTITCDRRDGKILLLAQAERVLPRGGGTEILNSPSIVIPDEKTGEWRPRVAELVMAHYFSVKDGDTVSPAALNAAGKAPGFCSHFLSHHIMRPGDAYEISGEVLAKWMELQQPGVFSPPPFEATICSVSRSPYPNR